MYCTLSRFGAIASSSSMKMIAGAFFSASSNAAKRQAHFVPPQFLQEGPKKLSR